MIEARHVRITGIVQGVGFRPFVYRLARAHGLHGWVLNAETGVEIHVEGAPSALPGFLGAIESQAPAASRIASFDIVPTLVSGFDDFTIRESERTSRPTVRISPDLPVCEDCLREMGDPDDRRFGYAVHQLHELRPALQHHSRLALRPSADDDARLADVRALRRRISRSARPSLSRAARRLSRLRTVVLFDGRRRHGARRRSGFPRRGAAARGCDRSDQRFGRLPFGLRCKAARGRRAAARTEVSKGAALCADDARFRNGLGFGRPLAGTRTPLAIRAAADRAGSGKG